MRKRKIRPLILRPDGCYDVPLTKGQTAVIDAQDAELVGQYNWCAQPTRYHDVYYAATNGPRVGNRRRRIMLHALIMHGPDVPEGHDQPVDHRDRDTLNCRRSNLRIVTPSQNRWNSVSCSNTGFKGVYANKSGTAEVRIHLRGKSIYIGTWPTAREAARAYDRVIREYHGEFAVLNLPEEHGQP